jgi:hypothetical protein
MMRATILLASFACYLAVNAADQIFLQQGVDIGNTVGQGSDQFAGERDAFLLRLQRDLARTRLTRADEKRRGVYNNTSQTQVPQWVFDRIRNGIAAANATPTDQMVMDSLADLQVFANHPAHDFALMCPEATFLASIITNSTTHAVTPICHKCAAGCAKCMDSSRSGCAKCLGNLSLLMVSEHPEVEFECVALCPACHSSIDGRCHLDNINCPLYTSTPSNAAASTRLAKHVSELKAVLLQVHAGEEGSRRRRSRRRRYRRRRRDRRRRLKETRRRCSGRRRRRRNNRANRRRKKCAADKSEKYGGKAQEPAEKKCAGKTKPIQEEIEAWDEDCLGKLRDPALGPCEARDSLDEKVKKFKDIAEVVKKATQPTMQKSLQLIGKLPIPFVGTACNLLGKLAKKAYNISSKAYKKGEVFEKNLKKLDKPCNKIEEAFTKIDSGVQKVQDKLDGFEKLCGCDCIQNSKIDDLVARSQSAREHCNVPGFGFPKIPDVPSLPHIVEMILQLLGDIITEFNKALNHKLWIWVFGWISFTLQDILDGLAWLLNLISGIVEAFITAIIDGILYALGLPPLDELMETLVDMLPLDVSWPKLPDFDFRLDITNPLPFDLSVGCVAASLASCIADAATKSATEKVENAASELVGNAATEMVESRRRRRRR